MEFLIMHKLLKAHCLEIIPGNLTYHCRYQVSTTKTAGQSKTCLKQVLDFLSATLLAYKKRADVLIVNLQQNTTNPRKYNFLNAKCVGSDILSLCSSSAHAQDHQHSQHTWAFSELHKQ